MTHGLDRRTGCYEQTGGKVTNVIPLVVEEASGKGLSLGNIGHQDMQSDWHADASIAVMW